MVSLNLSWMGENWFQKPPNSLSVFHFKDPNKTHLHTTPKSPNFASVSMKTFIKQTRPPPSDRYERMLDYYHWEAKNLPDYRHTLEVEKILSEDPVSERKENATPAEIQENKKLWEELERNPMVMFLRRAGTIADKIHEIDMARNQKPYRVEDEKLWKELPHVTGPDGRPMPRKSIRTKQQSDDKFWDFARQFFFGLWGFKQRHYPPGKPIDVAQAIGYKKLERRYYDFIMRSGGFWYKDRLGRSRGPCELINLKTAWAAGIVDTDTFIWGEDMDEWAPIGMVYGLEKAIATWEVRLGAAATAFIHKLMKGIPPWVPHNSRANKTYKQLQEEAIASKRRDLAVLKANGGIWPGVRTPSHALFLWASGSELTTILEEDHMPNKYISKDLREDLQELIPELRPAAVLSIEQAMDRLTYVEGWYREPLTSYTTGPPYIHQWNLSFKNKLNIYLYLTRRVYRRLSMAVPGFSTVAQKYGRQWKELIRRVKERKAQLQREADIRAGYRAPTSPKNNDDE